MSGCVLLFLEHENSKLSTIAYELCSEGYLLAQKLGVALEAVFVGSAGDELAALGEFGVERIYAVQENRCALFRSLPYAKAVSTVITEVQAQVVLFGATSTGRDIAPRIASELKCGLTADCTALNIGSFAHEEQVYRNKLLQIRPAFGGNIIATIVSPESYPSMATVRKGVLKQVRRFPGKIAEIVPFHVSFCETDFATEIVEVIRRERGVDLLASRIIVSAGMGAANEHSLALVEELAGELGGVVGASRAMVDSGLLSKDHQVGQTGTTVRPSLYIACGISGQIQHRAGMAESKRIVAINTDPDAPIFTVAHYGIVGDLNEVLPMMIQAYREKR